MTKNEILDILYDLKTREQAALVDHSYGSYRALLQQRIDALDYAMYVIGRWENEHDK